MRFVLEPQERKIFQKPQGKLYKSVKEIPLKKSHPIISIGDTCSEELRAYWKLPVLSIIDFKTQRTDPGANLKPNTTVTNPAGQITDELWNAVRTIRSGIVAVNGEEDLAVIPAIFLSDPGTQILYGQPGEGVVLLEVTEEYKLKLGKTLLDWQVRQGMKFLDQITPGSSVLIIHHADSDGCCSAAILHKYLAKRGVTKITTDSPIFSPRIGEDTKQEISKSPPDYLIVTDLGADSAEYLTTISKTTPVLIVDHHKIHEQTFGGCVLLNPCNLNLPDQLNPSACFLSFLLTNTCDWLTVIGTYGDNGHAKIPNLSKRVQAKYKLTEEQIRKAAHMIDSAEETHPGYAQRAVKILIGSKSPADVLISEELNMYELEIRTEIDGIIAHHKKNAIIDTEHNMLILPIRTKYNIKSDIANRLQLRYPKKLILVYEKRGGKIRISFRTLTDANFPDLIRRAMNGMKGTGGGHAKAAGANIVPTSFDRFIQNFKRELAKE